MRVTRFKTGYVIRVSNTEWEVLNTIHTEGFIGIADIYEDGASGLTGANKSIFTQIYNRTRPWMAVTEDKRK